MLAPIFKQLEVKCIFHLYCIVPLVQAIHDYNLFSVFYRWQWHFQSLPVQWCIWISYRATISHVAVHLFWQSYWSYYKLQGAFYVILSMSSSLCLEMENLCYSVRFEPMSFLGQTTENPTCQIPVNTHCCWQIAHKREMCYTHFGFLQFTGSQL